MKYVTYALGGGAILSHGICSTLDQVAAMGGNGVGVMAVAVDVDAATQYILNAVVTARPPCPVAASVAGRVITLTGIPLGSVGQITGDATITVNNTDPSGTNVLTFSNSGSFMIAIPCFPALDYLEGFILL